MPSKTRTYPRTTVRKITKGHAQKNVGKSIDPLVYLDYVLFMQELMQKAERKAKESGEKTIAARDIRKVTTTALRKFRG